MRGRKGSRRAAPATLLCAAAILFPFEGRGAALREALVTAVESGDRAERGEALRELLRLGRAAAPEWLELLSSQSASARVAAAQVLGELGVSEAGPALVNALEEGDAALAPAAVVALGRLKETRAVPALLARLADA